MKIIIGHIKATIVASSILLYVLHYVAAISTNLTDDFQLTLDPLQSLHNVGSDVSFTCSSPKKVTLNWKFNGNSPSTQITKGFQPMEDSLFIVNGIRAMPNQDEPFGYFSKLTLRNLRKDMSGKITCYVEEKPSISETASLVVRGVAMGSTCRIEADCTANFSSCQNGICQCLPDYLLRLTHNGEKICRKLVYRLFESCEFTEQCFQYDRRAVCSDDGYCVCSEWAEHSEGKCVSKRDITYSKTKDLYRIGLVGITCLIIIVITVSLWLTLRKSCNNQSVESQLAMIAQNMNHNTVVDVPDDKPPSYDDALQTSEVVNSPPNFFEALKSSTAASRLLRQVSAPAGQMLTKNTATQQNK